MNSAVLRKLVDVLVVLGVYCDGTDEVSVMEGDSVTLQTDVKADQHEKIKWFFNDTRIAEINGIMIYICTDVQCKERFRDRLKLDHQTGSLTIMNTRTTDTGLYQLEIINSGHESEKTFSVTVHGVSAAALNATKRKSVKEGESVTLELPEERKPNDLMIWYFNDTLIAEISGDQSEICTDVRCDERFRDRLKLDHQTGSLTIMNTRITDSGLYQLQINSSIRIILAVLTVNVVADSDLSPAAVAGIVVAVLIAAAAAVIYYCRHRARRKGIDIQCSHVQVNGYSAPDQNATPVLTAYAANGNPQSH